MFEVTEWTPLLWRGMRRWTGLTETGVSVVRKEGEKEHPFEGSNRFKFGGS